MSSNAAQSGGGLSQIPGNPSFRNAAVNAVAVVPLLSSRRTPTGTTASSSGTNNDSINAAPTNSSTSSGSSTRSLQSFNDLMKALTSHQYCSRNSDKRKATTTTFHDDFILVVPNSSLTRPGDWRYDTTPLSSFHWHHGCQRLWILDGRPPGSNDSTAMNRQSHDRLLNHSVSRTWIDLHPCRRTAAVVGVLSMEDCSSIEDFLRAEEELHHWAMQYSTPPYVVTSRGQSYARDVPIERLFVYDSFTEHNSAKIDLNSVSSTLGSKRIFAFPPELPDVDHATNVHLMNLHLNVVINDLAVAVFRDLEGKIKEYRDMMVGLPNPNGDDLNNKQQSAARRAITNMLNARSTSSVSTSSAEEKIDESQVVQPTLTVGSMAGLVNPESKLAKGSPNKDNKRTTTEDSVRSRTISTLALPKLLTPIDDDQPETLSTMTAKDVEAMRKRDIGRREKWCGDLSLLAGSPLDAYEHYLKAAEYLSSKNTAGGASGSGSTTFSSTLDPLWHASALEGCAAAHIAMADGGGYNVDEYLENNFQLPEEVMISLSSSSSSEDNVTAISKRGLKQTLPEVVFTLCEEALAILSRNQLLSHLYAELLLKLASYCADAAEGHLRCIWGMGDGCHSGVDGTSHPGMMMTDDSGNVPPRWLKTSTSKLLSLSAGPPPRKVPPLPIGLNDMAYVNTVFRTKKTCELLHAAVSIGTLDPATRVDIAAQSTIICLRGVKPTNWRGLMVDHLRLQRKAAYFSVLAAETLNATDKSQKCCDLWLLATRLYSREANHLGAICGNYGWASLRAHCLEALSMQGNSRTALDASTQLVSLLSELVPGEAFENDDQLGLSSTKRTKKRNTGKQVVVDELRVSRHDLVTKESEEDLPPGYRSDFGLNLEETELREVVANASQFARQLRDTLITNASSALLHSSQPKWSIASESVSALSMPGQPLKTALNTLKAVWPVLPYEICSSTQKHCLERMCALRRSLPTVSGSDHDVCSIYGTDGKNLPLYVSSAMAIQADTALEMECVKKTAVRDKSKEGAMATFFNPFEAKKNVKTSTVRVAEEEERAMRIEFGNKLSLPLEIQRSQLVFANDVEGRIKAASLSFVIPGRAQAFTVQFPFSVLSKPTSAGDGHDDNSDLFEVKGLDLTVFGRSFFLPIQELNDTSFYSQSENLPQSASVYPYHAKKKNVTLTDDIKPRVETFPCQPRLHVLFAESGAIADRFSVGISEGEICTIPPFRLQNYLGPSAKGKIEKLEIYSANVPGMSTDKKLYDSDAVPVADVDEATFLNGITWKENSTPLVFRALTGSLKLSAINGSENNRNLENSVVTIQIAASHNLSERIPTGTTIHIRFRYRGLSNSSTEVWRKKEVLLHVKHSKGPRISSIAFRPDLARDSALVEMKQATGAFKPVKVKSRSALDGEHELAKENEIPVLHRVGMDNEVNVCCDKSYFVLTVANETRSVLTLERPGGPVGGFESHPLETVIVRPGVSAKIPVVMDRIRRVDEKGTPTDIVTELVSRTSLTWKSHRGGEAGPVKARGNIRIPPTCLADILQKNPSLLSHICHPPCTIDLLVGTPVVSTEEYVVSLGSPVQVSVAVNLNSWVQKETIESCSLTIEFRCGRVATQTSSTLDNPSIQIEANSSSREYFWAGKLRHTIGMNDPKKKHTGKIVFCVVGQYAVSACVKICNRMSNREEVWWAPIARKVVVQELEQPIQW